MPLPSLSPRILLPVVAALALLACSPAPAPPAVAPAPAAQGEKELALYRTLREQGSWEYAAPIGKEIVERYPASAAATEVAATLAETTARAEAQVTRRRLERLWSYQSGTESGGQQVSASIYSDGGVAAERVRLVLRRHSDWGQSVYLYGSGKGFVCRGNCRIEAHFDAAPRKLAAYRPDTGEPALFIADDKDFIARLSRAQVIRMDVVEQDRGKRSLTFEVGGFDAAKFPPLARGK
ncbi:hypothetical protein [Dokdonella sp.]|uniref:hypothetical protein n=1 Tax=Dokdonella sp. TaxID=2291710 RepID=UPI0031CA34E4|nr:hypothetical protein [Dokdonella sp.]